MHINLCRDAIEAFLRQHMSLTVPKGVVEHRFTLLSQRRESQSDALCDLMRVEIGEEGADKVTRYRDTSDTSPAHMHPCTCIHAHASTHVHPHTRIHAHAAMRLLLCTSTPVPMRMHPCTCTHAHAQVMRFQILPEPVWVSICKRRQAAAVGAAPISHRLRTAAGACTLLHMHLYASVPRP